MSMAAAHKILEEALALPTDDRARVAAALIASLEEEGKDQDVEEAWAVEIEHRAERVLAGESQGASWEEVQERPLSRIKRT